jgi:hypothetical protein
VAEVGFDSLEGLLKRLSAPAELTHKLAKKLRALWLGPGGVALAGHSGQAQAALLLPPQSNSLVCVLPPPLIPSPRPENPRAPQLRLWRLRMQHGSLIKNIRKHGPDVWQFSLVGENPSGQTCISQENDL